LSLPRGNDFIHFGAAGFASRRNAELPGHVTWCSRRDAFSAAFLEAAGTGAVPELFTAGFCIPLGLFGMAE
jgi:hypothetical protein